VVLIELAPADAWAGAIVLLIVLVLGESILRATFVRSVNRVAVILALVATTILLVHFWQHVLVGVLIALAAFLVLQRVRELRA
jgi:MFS superfamily sulfate permease-like transporter